MVRTEPAFEKYNKVEHLGILKFFAIDLFQYTISKCILYLLLIIYVLGAIIQTYTFLTIFKLSFFVKYAATYAQIFFIIVACSGSIITSANLKDIILAVDLMKLETCNNNLQLKNQILKDFKLVSAITTINICVALMSSFAYLWPDLDDTDQFIILNTVAKFTPLQYQTVVITIFKVLIFGAIPYIMLCNLNQIIYISCMGRYQLLLAGNYIETINLYNAARPDYHQKIKNDLIVLIKFHCQLLKCRRDSLNLVKPYILLYAVTGGILIIGIIFFSISYNGSFLVKYIRSACVMLNGCIIGIGVVTAGQVLEDSSEVFSQDLYSLKWYNWNNENKQIFYMFLINAHKTLTIEFTSEVCLNYELGLQIVKTVYSTLSVLYQMYNN